MLRKPNESNIHFIVRYFTYLISPPTVMSALAFVLGYSATSSLIGFQWGLFYGILVALFPLLFVGYLLKNGKVTTLSMSRKERTVPYLVAVLSCIFAGLMVRWLDGPTILQHLAVVNGVCLAGLGLINLKTKISHHGTAVFSGAMLTGLVFGWSHLLWAVPLAIAVCYGRLYLGKHTLPQLIMGGILGSAVTLFTAWLGLF